MNTKTKKMFFSLLLAGMMCVPLTMSAQVTIGSGEAPQDFSVLELISNQGGLRLPQLTTQQRIDLEATFGERADVEARGLQIFNTCTRCVETWNGRDWISVCFEEKEIGSPGDFPVAAAGQGTLTGRTCFDIAETICQNVPVSARLSQRTDFTQRMPLPGLPNAVFGGVQPYRFTATADNVSNVRWIIEELNYSVIDQSQTPLSGTLHAGALANGAYVDLTVHFLSGLNTTLQGKDREQAARAVINIVFHNGTEDVRIPLNITIQDCACCGAFVAPGVWRAFMCHNLGADEILDPFTPNAGLHGAMFKWGTGIVALTAQEVLTISDAPTNPDWIDRGGTPPAGAAAPDWNMATANPCPPGWRVPTEAEWLGVIINNTIRRVGNYLYANNYPYPQGNFGSGAFFGDALFLPAAGTRAVLAGEQNGRGRNGIYWSSTRGGSQAFRFSFDPIQSNVAGTFRAHGLQVRCIAE